VLRRPAPARAGSVVVCPDDLIQEALPPEDLIEQQAAVVGLAVVDVEVDRSLALQQAMSLLQAGCEKGEIVLEGVPVGGLIEQGRAVAATLEPPAVTPASATVSSVLRDCSRPVLKGGSM